MAGARAAVIAAAQPVRRARCAPRRAPRAGSVAHQKMNRISVRAAATAGASHQDQAGTDADAPVRVQVKMPWVRSSQPQTWLSAYTGAITSVNVTATPSSRDSAPTRTVLASGAM